MSPRAITLWLVAKILLKINASHEFMRRFGAVLSNPNVLNFTDNSREIT